MAGRKATGARPATFVSTPGVDDQKTQRALDVLSAAVQELQVKGAGGKSVTGSRASGAALVSLLQQLESLGIIVDDTTA